MLQLDTVLIATTIGIVASVGGLTIKAVNLIRYLENKIDSTRGELKFLRHEINSSLVMTDYRLRDLEKHAQKHAGFSPHHQRSEQTGAPFLETDP